MEIKLNLIPKYKKEEIAKLGILKAILRWEMELSFVLVGFFLLLFSLNQILQISVDAQLSEIERHQDKEKYERINFLDGEFKKINSQVALDKSIQKDQLYWTRLFEKLSGAVPDEVSISKMANRNYKVYLAGISNTREDLLKMKESFSQEGCFTDVNLPLSNLVSKDDVAFQIEFNIKEECIKNK